MAHEAALGIYSVEAAPRGSLQTNLLLGRAFMAERSWRQAAAAFARGPEAFIVLFGQGVNGPEAEDLVVKAETLFSDAAYVAAELGETESAFLLLNEGKARLLGVALNMDALALGMPERKGGCRSISALCLPDAAGAENIWLIFAAAACSRSLARNGAIGAFWHKTGTWTGTFGTATGTFGALLAQYSMRMLMHIPYK